jgi:hypothetical protein
MSDIHADAAYRANLVSVMAKRAVMAAASCFARLLFHRHGQVVDN